MGNSINNHGNNNIILQDIKDSTVNIHHHTKPKLPKELTIRMPKVNLNDVIGREEEITELHQSLFEHKQVVLVNGLGGIGKTTLSQAYLTKYAEQYQHLAWITVGGTSLESDFINAVLLDKTFGIKTEGKELTDIFHEVLYDLKAIDTHPNLLILDNADATLSNYYDRLPQQPNWHVLVTSREHIDGFESKEIGFLKPDKALLLFQKHCTRITDVKAIENLLHSIDYHTLTIEILAKTAQLQRLDIATLQNAIDKDIRAGVYIKHNNDKIDKIYTYLSSIFDLSNVTDTEAWLLKQMACLPTDFHAYDLIKELICKPESEQAELLPESIESLVAKGWLLKNPEADSYKMHIIIAEVSRRKLEVRINDVEVLLDNVTNILEIDYTKDNPVEKFQWVEFGKALESVFGKELLPKVSVLKNNLALVLKALGNYVEAKELLEKALISDEKNFGENHPNTARTYSNLALVLEDLGEYENAKILLQKALISAEKNFGENHPATATTYSNLALVLHALEEYEPAKLLLQKALISDEKNFGENHSATAVRYSNLATVLQALGEYEPAKLLLQKALISAEKNFGESHPTTVSFYSNLALVLKDLGEYEPAKLLLQKALISDKKNFGENHPSTARTYSNLALVLQALGEETAKILYQKALISAEKNFGENHPTTAVRYSNLATVLKDLGEYEPAKLLLQKALISDKKNFGENHPTTAGSYSNLAMVLCDLEEYETAKILLQKALISNEKNFGEAHPSTANTYSNLALVLQALGEYETAKILYQKALISAEKNFGENHPTTAVRYSNLATVLQDLGEYEPAKLLLQKALISDKKNFGENHPTTAGSYSNLAMVLCDLRDYQNAITLLEKAYNVYYNHLGEQHPYTQRAKINLYYGIQKSKKQKPSNFLGKLFNFFKS